MWLLDLLAEEHIAEARRRGEFDRLPGAGKPLVLDDDRLVPETEGAALRVLKNAGLLPPGVDDLNELRARQSALAGMDLDDPGQRQALHRLRLLELRLRGGGLELALDARYADRVLARLGGSTPA
jgi:hypothetical protein